MSDVRIRGFVPSDAEALQAVAKADEHEVIRPTYVVEKEGKIVGFLSINPTPTVFLWMDSKQTGVRDSTCVQNFLDNVLAQNFDAYMMPCKQDSPYFNHMEKLGFSHFMSAGIFFRSLTKG